MSKIAEENEVKATVRFPRNKHWVARGLSDHRYQLAPCDGLRMGDPRTLQVRSEVGVTGKGGLPGPPQR